VVINNLSGNKLDYYLTRQIEYSADACDSEARKSTVTVRLINNVPNQPLPDYVAGQEGLVGLPVQAPNGTNVSSISLLATKGAKLTGTFANGMRVPHFTATERGHPIFNVQLLLPPGTPVEVKFELTEPTSPGAPRVPIQPLRDNPALAISVPVCSG
jgi:hypothetical protein